MTTKEKYEMIDKSKVRSPKTLEILEKMQKASTNFTNPEVNAKIDSALDRLIEGFKANNPSALITPSQAKEKVKKEKTNAQKKNEGKDLSEKKDTDDKTGLPKKDTVEERKDIIKKESESEKEARDRAKKELEKENEKAKDVIESQLEKLNRIILEDPALQGFNKGFSASGGGKSTPIIDAERKALPRGKRVSKKGWKNQYGASEGGRTYWENRENRTDRKSPDYPTGKPYLAKGGNVYSSDDVYEVKMVQDGVELDSKFIRAKNKGEARMIFEDMYQEKYQDEFGAFELEIDVAKSRLADGGETDGNVVQYGDKVIITTDNLGEKYKGMQGEIMPTHLLNDKYSIKLENGLTMTFDKGEFRHNSINPKYAKGGKIEPKEARFDVTLYDDDGEKYYSIVYAEDEDDAIRKAENWHNIESVDSNVMMITDYDGKNLYFAKGGYMEHRGTITDDSLESILKSDFPKSNYQLDHDNISGHKIYGQKDVIKTIQKHLLTEYGIKSEYDKEGFGLPFLRVYSQFVDKYAQGGKTEQFFSSIQTDRLRALEDEIATVNLMLKKLQNINTEEAYQEGQNLREYKAILEVKKINLEDGLKNKGGYMADGGEVGNWRENALGDGSIELINSGVYIRDNTGNYGRGRYDVYKRGDYDWRTSSTGVTLLASFDDLEEAKQYGYNNSYAKGGYMADGGENKLSYEEFEETLQEYEVEGGFGKTLEKGYRMYYLPNGNPYLNTKFKHRNKKKAYQEYLEMNKMGKGGYMAEGENYEYVNTFKRFDSDVPVPQDDFEKLVDAYHKQLSGDKLAVAKYNVLKVQMGNYLGHQTVEEMEEYIQKTHEAHKMADAGVFDDEGNLIDIKVGDEVVEYRKRFPNAEEKTQIGPKGRVIKIVDAFAKVSFPNDYEENILLRNLKKMAHGGETESEPLGVNESVYFEVYDGNRNYGIIKFRKSGSRILETLLIGNVKAGNRRYMSYFTKNDLKLSLNRDFDVVNEVDEDYVNDRLISYEKSKPADIFVVKYPYPELAKTADTLTIIKGGEQVFDYDPVTKDFTVVSIGLSYPDQIELDDFLEDSKGVSERQYTPELIKVIEVVKENEDISEIVNELKSKGLIQKYQYTMADGGSVNNGNFEVVSVMLNVYDQQGGEQLYEYLEEDQGLDIVSQEVKDYRKEKGVANEYSSENGKYDFVVFKKADLRNIIGFEKMMDEFFVPMGMRYTYSEQTKMSMGGYISSGKKLYDVSNNMSDKEFQEAYLKLSDREKDIYDKLNNEYENGGEVETILVVPKYLKDEIIESINLGYDELVVGMISKNRKGVLLVNENYEVRGTYDMALKNYIENIIEKHKTKKSKGGYMADGGEVDFSKKMEKMRSAYENLDMIVKSKIAMAIGIDNAISIMDTDYVVHPFHLIKGAVSSGLLEIDEINGDLVGSAIQEAGRIDEDYRDSGEGIGSSDITYFTKYMLRDAGYKTEFIDHRLKRVDDDGNELVINKYEMDF